MLKETPPPRAADGSEHVGSGSAPPVAVCGVCRILHKGDLLFVEGDDHRGIFIIHSGRVKLSTSLADGKLITIYIAEAGAIVGLNAVIGDCEHEVTAEALEPTSAEFIRANDVNAFLLSDPAFAVRVAGEMARRYRSAHSVLCTLAKSDPVQIKLAGLIAGWLAETGGTYIENAFTHQQIAEMLGTTRETITRAFGRLREAGILTLKGHLIEVHDIARLHAITTRCDMPHRLDGEASRNIYM
jgi:CRP/FNR family cyclic AMP-dependent transcriptional regulator